MNGRSGIIIGVAALAAVALVFFNRGAIMVGAETIGRRLSTRGARFIAKWEGFRPESYRDIAGIWTIGYGHTGPEVGPGQTITRAQALELKKADAQKKLRAIDRLVKVPLTQNQVDALTSLVFNIGEGAFGRSTVLRELNRGNYPAAGDAFEMWNKSTIGGVLTYVQGLANRRAAEKRLFLS